VRILLITLGVLLGLLVLAAAGVALVLDPLVKRVATEESSAALGVPVELADADASLFGRLALDGFVAGNPRGFAEPRSIRFDRVAAKARVGSVFDDVLEIDEVVVRRPELTIEFQGQRSNIKALMDHLGERRPAGKKDPEGRAFRIRTLRMEGATLRFKADVLGENVRELTLPTITLRDVGTSADAATMSEILASVLQTLAAEAVKLGKDLVPAELLRSLAGDLEEAARRFGGRIEERIRDLPKQAGERVEDEIEKGLDKLREKLP
jgi:uncharacterized protein involved in outer membrane biogenesis